MADAGDGGGGITARVRREQLVHGERSVWPAGDDVGERTAAVDPELPASSEHCLTARSIAGLWWQVAQCHPDRAVMWAGLVEGIDQRVHHVMPGHAEIEQALRSLPEFRRIASPYPLAVCPFLPPLPPPPPPPPPSAAALHHAP